MKTKHYTRQDLDDMSDGKKLEEFVRKEFCRDFSEKLIAAMNEKGLNGTQLATKTRISTRTISAYCHGHSSPSTYNLYKLAIVLEKPILYFF